MEKGDIPNFRQSRLPGRKIAPSGNWECPLFSRRSEVDPRAKLDKEPPAGSIRNVLIQNVIAHGNGSSVINGHPDSWLDGITFSNIKLFLTSDPTAPL